MTVNSYHFISAISSRLPSDAVVVCDAGSSYTCTFQAATIKLGQRWIYSHGVAPMGYGLPAAIGAAFATGRKVICIVGDGGLQMNLQELATIAHHKLPITIFVLNNGGYLTMRHTCQNHFGRMTGVGPESGLSFPDLRVLSKAYGLPYFHIREHDALVELDWLLMRDFPHVVEIAMPHDQPLIPRSSSFKLPDGSITSKPPEDMYPFLSREEFLSNMIVKPIDALK